MNSIELAREKDNISIEASHDVTVTTSKIILEIPPQNTIGAKSIYIIFNSRGKKKKTLQDIFLVFIYFLVT